MSQRKFADDNTISRLVYNIKNFFAPLSHSHTKSEITDFTVDEQLSSTSANPVQNKVINSVIEDLRNTLTKLSNLQIDVSDDGNGNVFMQYAEYIDAEEVEF